MNKYRDYSERDFDGSVGWRDESGNYHRTDGPAKFYKNGIKEWYIHGKVLDIFEACTAESILNDMPLEDIMMYMGDPVMAPFIKTRLEKESNNIQ